MVRANPTSNRVQLLLDLVFTFESYKADSSPFGIAALMT
jgi:hypothetical protein